jgi:hypothetical protein
VTGKRGTPSDLERARAGVSWVDDDDLDDIERKSPTASALLSLVTWGGGQMYTYARWRGAAMITGMLGAIMVLAGVLPEAIPLLVVGGSLGSAVDAARRARKINRYAKVRSQLALTASGDPAHYRLLASAAAVAPNQLGGAVPALAATLPPPALPAPTASGKHAALIERLQKISTLNRSKVISDHELRERKVDLLEEAAPETRDALDEMLFELLPLVDQGVLDQADIDFLKQLAGQR